MFSNPRAPRRVVVALLALLAGASFAAAQENPPEDETAATPTSLGDVLSGAQGVRVATMCTNCNIANVTMCGQSDDRVQIWLDGLPTVGGLGGIYALSILPTEAVAQSEIIRGAGTVLSGSEASAGAIVLTTKAPAKTPVVVASADFGTYGWAGAKALASGKLGAFGGGIVLTNAQSSGIDPNGDGAYELGELRRNTAGGEVSIDFTRDTTLRVMALRYNEAQRLNKGGYAPSETPPFFAENVDIERNEYSLFFEHRFADQSRLSIAGRLTERDQVTSDDSSALQPYLLVDERAREVEGRYQTPIAGRHMFTAGMVYRLLVSEGTTSRVPPFYPFLLGIDVQTIRDEVHHNGFYAEFGFDLGHGFDLTAGLRYDDYGQFGKEYLPRTRLGWKPISQLGLALSYGDGLLAPRPAFERVCCGARVQSINLTLGETSSNYLFDADWTPATWIRIKGSLFRSEFDDFIQKLAVDTNDYTPTYQQVNYPSARIEGGELSVEARWKGFSLRVEGTRTSPESQETLTVFPYRDVPDPDPPDPFKQLFVDTLRAISYDLEPGRLPNRPWDLAAASLKWDDDPRGLHFAAEAQYTGCMLIQTLREGPQIFEPPPRAYEYRRTPSFTAYNARAKVRVHEGLSLYGGVDNITNEVQDNLDRPEWEYNWGLLRGRYYYGGLSYEM